MSICIIIPNYNHGKTLAALLQSLETYQLPCIIIDDGSGTETKQLIQEALQKYSFASLVTLAENQGKGGAVLAGLQQAYQQGYTHAIQIDADCQHDISDIPKFLQAIKQQPNALISGYPQYNDSVPKSRLYGRKITNFWCAIETFSRDIKDAMCGFRAYPLALIMPVVQQGIKKKRMGFDIEIMVKAHWAGIPIVSVPTQVIYPEEGISHFNPLKDNIEISLLHTRLFFSMPYRLIQKKRNQHWSKIQENGSVFFLKLSLWIYNKLGETLMRWLLYPITAYYACFSRSARQHSKRYLSHLPPKKNQTVFRHFLSFSNSIIDKLSSWSGHIQMDQIHFPNQALLRDKKEGVILLTAHLGNIEISRALSRFVPNFKVNAVTFTQHAKKINHIFKSIDPEFNLNLIETPSIDIKLAMQLQQKIDDGEHIAIVADRISTSDPTRFVAAEFLGETAYFPQGPFLLAAALEAPVYFMLCLKNENGEFDVILEPFAEALTIKRPHRMAQLTHYTEQYAKQLEKYCHQYPLQWYNFFNFWHNPTQTGNTHD